MNASLLKIVYYAFKRSLLLFPCLLITACNLGNNKNHFGNGWQKIPIELIEAGPQTIESLRAAPGRMRLLTVWASWSDSCSEAFPHFMNLQEKVLEFLKQEGAAVPNYIAKVVMENQIIENLDPQWEGELPLTMLLSAQGEVIYREQGPADIEQIQLSIENHLFKDYIDPESTDASEKESSLNF